MNELAEYCDFGSSRDEQIQDRIVIGLLNKNVSQSLQMKAGLDLQSAVEMARQAELVKNQISEREWLETKQVDEVRRRNNRRRNRTKDSRIYFNNNNCVVGATDSMQKSQYVQQEVRDVKFVLK